MECVFSRNFLKLCGLGVIAGSQNPVGVCATEEESVVPGVDVGAEGVESVNVVDEDAADEVEAAEDEAGSCAEAPLFVRFCDKG